jgi:hypothetical protein
LTAVDESRAQLKKRRTAASFTGGGNFAEALRRNPYLIFVIVVLIASVNNFETLVGEKSGSTV